jgi:hypothetical protein
VARIRSIKPESAKSLTLTSWPREVRLAWYLLSMYLDDCGRGIDNLRSILGECFPEDRDVTERKLDQWLELMADKPHKKPSADPALCRYEVDGVRYLHTPKWKQHQKINRPSRSHLPECPIHGEAVE